MSPEIFLIPEENLSIDRQDLNYEDLGFVTYHSSICDDVKPVTLRMGQNVQGARMTLYRASRNNIGYLR